MQAWTATWLFVVAAEATEPPVPDDPFDEVLVRMQQLGDTGYARGGTMLAVLALEEHPDHPRTPLIRLQVARYQRAHALLREEELTLARGVQAYSARWRPWFELALLDAQLQRQDFGAIAAAHRERAEWPVEVSDAVHYYGAWGRAGAGDEEGARVLLAKVRGPLREPAEGFSHDLAGVPARRRSPVMAGVLSVLPGVGHAYAGDPVGAAANLVVTGGLGAAAAWFSTQEEPVLTTVFGILGAGSLLAGMGDAGRQASSFNRMQQADRFETLANRWWLHGELTGRAEEPIEVRIGSWDDGLDRGER